MKPDIAILRRHYGSKVIPEPYSNHQTLRTAYVEFQLEQLTGRTQEEIDQKYPEGVLKTLREASDTQIVNYLYALEQKPDKTYWVHVRRTLSKPQTIKTLLKKFSRAGLKIHQFERQAPNERYLLSRRLLATFGPLLEESKISIFFSNDQRLINVICQKDPGLYTKVDLLKAKAAHDTKRPSFNKLAINSSKE